LPGIFDVEIAPAYSEGAASAFRRLKDEIDKLETCVGDARIRSALEKWAARQPQSTRSLRVDDGKPPTNTNTFVISTGPSLTTHGHDGHEGHDGHDGYDGHESHDGHDGRPRRP
jgi:hypothetical protein